MKTFFAILVLVFSVGAWAQDSCYDSLAPLEQAELVYGLDNATLMGDNVIVWDAEKKTTRIFQTNGKVYEVGGANGCAASGKAALDQDLDERWKKLGPDEQKKRCQGLIDQRGGSDRSMKPRGGSDRSIRPRGGSDRSFKPRGGSDRKLELPHPCKRYGGSDRKLENVPKPCRRGGSDRSGRNIETYNNKSNF